MASAAIKAQMMAGWVAPSGPVPIEGDPIRSSNAHTAHEHQAPDKSPTVKADIANPSSKSKW